MITKLGDLAIYRYWTVIELTPGSLLLAYSMDEDYSVVMDWSKCVDTRFNYVIPY
jgi:hypothetical protein